MTPISMLAIVTTIATVCAAPGDDPRIRFAQGLASLNPKQPEGYLELAEEILDERNDHETRKLAIELCVLAHKLDIDDGGDTRIASSACALLASMPGNEAHASWLGVMARDLGDVFDRTSFGGEKSITSVDHSIRYRISTLLGQLRSGDGIGVRTSLAKAEIADSVKSFERVFISLGVIADPAEMLRQASRWPCPDCGNDRLVRRAQSGSGEPWKICVSCGGVPGPRLFRSELLSALRVESFLLEGIQRSWSAQMSIDFGAPLVDPVPETVSQVFRCDTTRSLFRDGKWVKPE